MAMSKAERTAQINRARVEVAKCDREIAGLNEKARNAGDLVKKLELKAKVSEAKSSRAHFSRIIKDRKYAANH